MTPEAKLDELELKDLEQLATRPTLTGGWVALRQATVLSLVAEVRRARRLESAIAFMNAKGHWQNTTPEKIIAAARDFGWKEST